jgi:hypothetical protein
VAVGCPERLGLQRLVVLHCHHRRHRSAPGPDDIVRCSEWDQVRGVTRRFRDFVDRFAPPEDSEGITRGRLYAIRSDLAHGRVLFDLDEAAPWSRLRLTPNRLEQDEARDMLARLVKRVIIGWVLVAGG